MQLEFEFIYCLSLDVFTKFSEVNALKPECFDESRSLYFPIKTNFLCEGS